MMRIRLKRRHIWVSLVAAMGVTAALVATAVGLASASNHSRPKFVIPHVGSSAKDVVSSGPDAYPSAACESSNPTSLLIPVADLSGMSLGLPAYAGGSGSLNPMAVIPATGSPEAAASSYAARIAEHMFDTNAPSSAIESADPFNAEDPHAVTSFDEEITGFTNATAEAAFWSEGTPQPPYPVNVVNGKQTTDVVTTTSNVASLPTPNVVSTFGLPSSNVPTTINIGVQFGSTVVGMTFEGGDQLSLSDVLATVDTALNTLASGCPGSDIMAG